MKPGSYEEWIRRYDTLTPADRESFRAEEERLGSGAPQISIILPVYNPEIAWLREAIDSVKAQIYSRWELCLADDASTQPGVREFLQAQAESDARIRLVLRASNGHISACSNSALDLAHGDWCGFLDQDDLLAPHALSLVAREIAADPSAGLIYSDEDFIDVQGVRSNPFIKPDWNSELFLGQNYLNHFSVYRAGLLREIGGFREGYEGSQDYDLALRAIARLQRGQIRHIPRVLYHWRMVPGSLADARDAKPYAKDAARLALEDHVRVRGWNAQVEPCPENIESHRVRFALPRPAPKVSLVTDAIKGVAEEADVLIFHRGHLIFPEPDWVGEMTSHAMRPEVGVVGARIWTKDGVLARSGYLLGVGGVAADAHRGLPRGHPGFFNRTFLQRNCAAVSSVCMAVRASVFRELSGFDEINLARNFRDIDFCLRARARGYEIVWTPYVNPVGDALQEDAPWPADVTYMQARWADQLPADPFYSPSLSLLPNEQFELAFPPRWWKGSTAG